MSSVEKLFSVMDLNKDGFVEPDDIKKCFGLLGAPPHIITTELQTLMTRDADGDGKLSKAEFTVADYKVAGRDASWLANAIEKNLKEEEKKKGIAKNKKALEGKGAEFFEYFLGENVIGKDKKEVSTKSIVESADYVAIYMSAHWCPPCRGFTPKLAKVFEALEKKNSGKKLSVIFVTCDRDKESFDEYYGTMPWHAVPFSKKDYIGFGSMAGLMLECNGIPMLAVFDKSGKLITKSGVQMVYENGEGFLAKL